MTQTSSAVIVTLKPSMEYAELCMGMRLGNVRYSACASVVRSACATQIARFGHNPADEAEG
jgi:hypothetical protein